MFLITVTGEIIAKDKNHYAQNWACRSIGKYVDDHSYHYDQNNHTVQSNLILNKNIRAVPYAIYVTDKGIRTESSGEIFCAPGAMAAELCYKDNISEIETLYKVSIPSKIELYLFNGLLTGVLSVLELFLSDVLLCLIYTNRDVYDRAIEYMKNSSNKKGQSRINNLNQDLAIQRHFTEDIVYHRFDKVRLIFKKILGVKFPNTKVFISYLKKRNNISHRFAFSNIDRMKMTEIDLDTLKEFILYCNEFVEKLMNEIRKRY